MNNALHDDLRSYPEEIRDLPCCNWRWEKRNGNDTKVPYDPVTGKRAQVNTPDTFAKLDTALEALPHYDGIGIRIEGRIGCIDVDDAIQKDGTLTEKAQKALDLLPEAWAEISPSGTGLHLYFLIPEGYVFDSDLYYVNNRKVGMENYFPGCSNRFITVTGNIFRKGSLAVSAEQLRLFQDTFMKRPEKKKVDVVLPTGGSVLSDAEVIRKASCGKQGRKFQKLYQGEWEGLGDENWSHSEADMSFHRILAFYCRGDMAQMDRIYRESGLVRDKWDERRGNATYGEITMTNAIKGCTEFYEPDYFVRADFEEIDEDDAEAAETADRQDSIDAILAAEITIDSALSPELLSLAAWAFLHDMTRYVKLRNHIPKAVGIRIFEREVQKLVKGGASKTTAQLLRLSGIQTPGMLVPENWVVSDSGIRHMEMVLGELKPVLISAEPLFVSAKLVNVDDSTEKLEITFRRNGKYKTLIAPRADMLNKNVIIRYADAGFPVSSGTAGSVTKFIAEMESANAHVIPIRRAIRRAGWVGNEFYPYSMKDGIVAQTDGNETERLLGALQKAGCEETWLATAAKARTMPFARAMLAASFASPLLEKLHHRNIYVHNWYGSRSGKTAVLKLAMSVWGDPRTLVSKYFSTIVGMERTAGTLKHLPFALDELQTLNQKRLSVNDVVYTLGNGVGKTRGRVGDGIQKIEEWHNCILSTGEQPMSAENSMDGVNTRLMELYACPLNEDGVGAPDDELGKELHQVAESNYGFAGETYIRWVIDHLGGLRDDYSQFLNALESRCVQRDNIAVLALADYYSSIAVFHLRKEQAYTEAVALGKLLLKNQEDNAPRDSIESAWEFVCGWIASNKVHFCTSTLTFETSPVFGKAERNTVYVIAAILNDALEQAGFSARKCIRGFQERNMIRTFTDSQGKVRSQTTTKIKGTPVKAYVLNIDLEEEPQEFPPLTADEPDFLQ